MNGDQLRMARALLRLTVRELAQTSGVDKMAIVRFEAGRNPHAATLTKLRTALEEHGIVFIGAVSTFHEPTVAMRFGMQPPAVTEDDKAGDEENNEANQALSPERLDALWRHWGGKGMWARLSHASIEALKRAIRGGPRDPALRRH